MNDTAEKITDLRLDFIKEFCLRTLRVKSEKFDRLLVSDEQRSYVMGFIERQIPQVIFCNFVEIMYINQGSHLYIYYIEMLFYGFK